MDQLSYRFRNTMLAKGETTYGADALSWSKGGVERRLAYADIHRRRYAAP
jgi:hypothetical protein